MSTGKYRNIKLRVSTREQAIAVQELLFADGVTWSSGDTNPVEFSREVVFFVSPTGKMTHSSTMTPGRDCNVNCVEMSVEFETKLVASVKERQKTVLFGKTYYTDELNARLEGLKAC